MRRGVLEPTMRWCAVAAPLAVALALLIAGAACTPSSATGESGALCWDGKDNDDDGAADCDDSECANLNICRRTQSRDVGPIRPDFAAPDRGVPTTEAGGPTDSTVDRPPTQTSSYGQPCRWQGTVTQCPDGKTFCVLSPTNNGTGYCTYTCNNQPDDCPPPPNAQMNTRCLYQFNGVPVCTFMCRLVDLQWSCPSGMKCYTLNGTQQAHCWLPP